MLNRASIVSLIAVAVSASADTAIATETQPTPVTSRIETVGLFKNGLAVVRRTVSLPGAGVYDLTDLPEPVHGTLWVESTAELTITVTEAELAVGDDEQPGLPGMDNGSLAGSRITVYFKQEHLPTVQGVVAQPPAPKRQWDRSYGYTRPRHQWWWAGDFTSRVYPLSGAPNAPLVINTDQGEVVLDTSTIAYLRIDERAAHPTRRQPVLRIEAASEPGDDPIDVGILYLTKGASWAPSYAMDISESSQLLLRQKAIIRNELEDLHNVEILLISGFPSIEFGHVLSPMSPATDLAGFFRALGTENRLSHSSRGDVMAQSVMTNVAAPGFDASGPMVDQPTLEGVDMHYYSVGRHTLALGETLMINTAAETAPFERVVKWTMDDDRDEWGSRRRAAGSANDQPWDALRFRNPMNRPMTTAPATIVADGMVRGQSMVHWSGPGERIVLPVNRSLSVRAWAVEHEIDGSREQVSLYNRTFWRASVQGTLEIVNQRAEPVTFIARVEFSGELLETDGDPETSLRAEGVWSVNPRRQMTWTLLLEPGQRRTLEYTYRVLAPR